MMAQQYAQQYEIPDGSLFNTYGMLSNLLYAYRVQDSDFIRIWMAYYFSSLDHEEYDNLTQAFKDGRVEIHQTEPNGSTIVSVKNEETQP